MAASLETRPDITVRAVLQHRAGLPRHLPEDYDAGQTDLASWLAAHTEQLQPAGEERYSNVGYALLADVVAKAAGAPFTEVAQRRVLAPAGMHDSMIRPGTAKDVARGARPYTAGPGPDGVMTPIPSPLEIGSSGLITTAADLARWARTLADGAYPELFEGDDPLGSIDTGSDENGAYVSVQGTLPGYSANAIAWRDSGLTISYTGNLFSYPVLDLAETLRALAGDHPPPPPGTRPPAVLLDRTHSALAGQYVHPGFGNIAIGHDPTRGGMVLTMPGKPEYWSFHLTPIADGGLHWRAFGIVFRRDGAGGCSASPMMTKPAAYAQSPCNPAAERYCCAAGPDAMRPTTDPDCAPATPLSPIWPPRSAAVPARTPPVAGRRRSGACAR